MENPATWGKVEKIIMDEIMDHEYSMKMGMYGLSLPRRIANRLRQEGLVKEESNDNDNA